MVASVVDKSWGKLCFCTVGVVSGKPQREGEASAPDRKFCGGGLSGERTALSHPNLLHTCAMILQNGTGEWLDQHSFPWDAEAGSAKLSPEFSSGLKTHEKFQREGSFLRVVSLNYKLTSISQTSKSSKNRAR